MRIRAASDVDLLSLRKTSQLQKLNCPTWRGAKETGRFHLIFHSFSTPWNKGNPRRTTFSLVMLYRNLKPRHLNSSILTSTPRWPPLFKDNRYPWDNAKDDRPLNFSSPLDMCASSVVVEFASVVFVISLFVVWWMHSPISTFTQILTHLPIIIFRHYLLVWVDEYFY